MNEDDAEPTAIPPTLALAPLSDEEQRRILYAIDNSATTWMDVAEFEDAT